MLSLPVSPALRGCQCPELEDCGCESERISVDPEVARDLLLHLDPCNSMGPGMIHPRTLKDLAGTAARPLLAIFE